MPARWLAWSDVPWLQRSQPNSQWLHLSDRLASLAAEASSPKQFQTAVLSPISMEFGATWAAIVERTDGWQVAAELGMRGGLSLPVREAEEAADRDAAGWIGPHDDQSVPILVAPLSTRPQSALILRGRVTAEQLSPLLMVARVLSTAVAMQTSMAAKEREATRLRAILEISRRLANETETQPLLEMIAKEATRLLDSDRASIFIWDREQKQLIASPALGVSGGKLYLPDSKGIVGTVVQTGTIAQVDDAYSDPRFDQSVDKANNYRTRNLLCVPLVNGANQRIGAFELINKNRGDFTTDDQRTLVDLGAQAAIAIENARRHDQLVRSNKQLTERVMGGVEIIGDSPAMNALRGTIDRLANTDLPVLILGESGTGKEVAAQS